MYKEILRNFKIVHVYEDTNFVYNGGSNLKIVEIFLIFPHLSFLPLFDDSRLKFSISTPLVSSCICYKYLFTIRAEAEVGGFTRVLSKGLDPASSGKITLKVHSLPFDEIRRTNYGLLIVYPGEEGGGDHASTRTI